MVALAAAFRNGETSGSGLFGSEAIVLYLATSCAG